MKTLRILFASSVLVLSGCSTNNTLIVKDVDVLNKRLQAERAVASYGFSVPDASNKIKKYIPNGTGLGYVDY